MPKSKIQPWKTQLDDLRKQGKPKILKEYGIDKIICECREMDCMSCMTDIYDLSCCKCKGRAIYKARLSDKPSIDQYFCEICLKKYST